MKKIICILFFVISSRGYAQKFSERFIDSLSANGYYPLDIVIPVWKENEKVDVLTTNSDFFRFYKKSIDKKQFINYKLFLNEVLNGNYLVKDYPILKYQIIEKSSLVFGVYRRAGLDSVKSCYIKIDSKGRWRTKKSYPLVIENALIAIMFANEYFVGFDDKYGVLYFWQW